MAAIPSNDLLDRTDLIRLDVSRRLDESRRAEMGQFFTPAAIAKFMADMSEVQRDELRLLDPGAGTGSLSAAWVAHTCGLKRPPKRITLTAYEADADLAGYLRDTLQECAATCKATGIKFRSDVIEADFINAAVEMLTNRPLLGSVRPSFDCVMLNPPYRKLNSQSDARHLLRSIGIETSNLYAAFLWLSFRLLDASGELIAITPRSFCNGPYFRPFREAFLREMTFRRIHVFESRKSAFKDADVLQENVIFRAVKNKQPCVAVISSSNAPDDPDIALREVEEVVSPTDPDFVIHIVADEIGMRVAERVNGFAATLPDLGIQVSTGRVVDFRAKGFLIADYAAPKASGKTAPLIYPTHFAQGGIVWPREGKKPNHLRIAPETESLLVPAGVYVLVKRFSAKEEKRRVMAAICEPSRLPKTGYAFENHLNYFHQNGGGLPATLAKGLAAYLNSTLVDSYFRQFSGHTQVNASDLRGLKYPDVATLERIGAEIGDVFPSQEQIDRLIHRESNMSGDDPIKAKQRIEQSQEILKALGLPKAQQNERSALALLALLDLSAVKPWSKASAPSLGISEMMDWFADHYGKRYKENSRESVRRYSIHQFIAAGIVVQNPDDPTRPTNSQNNVYQIEAGALELLRTYGTPAWEKNLKTWLSSVETLKTRYAKEREMTRIPLKLAGGKELTLSPGGQNVLVKQIIDEFCPRFVPGGMLLHVGDTDTKWAHLDKEGMAAIGIEFDSHGKFPDVIAYDEKRNWLILIEAVTSHGPVDGKRRDELKRLFEGSSAGLVYVTAFLDRAAMVRYLGDISWETEVWVADAPSHMIHFNGERFLGPYED